MSAVVFPLVVFVKYTTSVASKVIDSVHKPITSTPASRAAAKKESATCPGKVVRRSPSTTSINTEPIYASSTPVESAAAADSSSAAPERPPPPAKRVSFATETPEMRRTEPAPEPSPAMMEEGQVFMERSISEPGDEESARRGWYEPVNNVKGKQVARPRARSASPHYTHPPLPLRRPARIRFLCKLLFAPLTVLRLLWSQLQKLIFGVQTTVSDISETSPLQHAVLDPPLMRVVVGESTGLLRRDGPPRITLPHEIAIVNGPAPSPDRFMERPEPAYEPTVPRRVSPPASPKVAPVQQAEPEPVCTRIDGAELLLEETKVALVPVVPALPSIDEAAATELPDSCASSFVEVTLEMVNVEEPANVCEEETTKISETLGEDHTDTEDASEGVKTPEKLTIDTDHHAFDIERSPLSPVIEESETVPPTPAPQAVEIDPVEELSKDIHTVVVPETVVEESKEVAKEIPEAVEEPIKAPEPVLPVAEVTEDKQTESSESTDAKVEIPVVPVEEAPIAAEPVSETRPVETITATPTAEAETIPTESVEAEAIPAAPAVTETPDVPVPPTVETIEPTVVAEIPAPAPIAVETASKAESTHEKSKLRMPSMFRSSSKTESTKMDEEDPLEARKPKRTWTFRKDSSENKSAAPSDSSITEEKKRPLLRSFTTMGSSKKSNKSDTESLTDAAPPKLEKRMSWAPAFGKPKSSGSSTGASSPKPPSESDTKKKGLGGLFRKSTGLSKEKLDTTTTSSRMSIDETAAATKVESSATATLTPPGVAAAIPQLNMPPTPPLSIMNSNAVAVSPSELTSKLSGIQTSESEITPSPAAVVEKAEAPAPTTPEKKEKTKARWMGGMKRAMTIANVAKKK